MIDGHEMCRSERDVLDRKIKELTESCEVWKAGCHERRLERDAAEEKIKKLEQFVLTWAGHAENCSRYIVSSDPDDLCTCGFEEAQEKLKKETP